mmetsp:Transcript_60162/g.160137  ORF Transcript_60162/g.160137 Transcript_60162/m.160137 type:complete len:211 (+) Transcript_60162:221-853(+)
MAQAAATLILRSPRATRAEGTASSPLASVLLQGDKPSNKSPTASGEATICASSPHKIPILHKAPAPKTRLAPVTGGMVKFASSPPSAQGAPTTIFRSPLGTRGDAMKSTQSSEGDSGRSVTALCAGHAPSESKERSGDMDSIWSSYWKTSVLGVMPSRSHQGLCAVPVNMWGKRKAGGRVASALTGALTCVESIQRTPSTSSAKSASLLQ